MLDDGSYASAKFIKRQRSVSERIQRAQCIRQILYVKDVKINKRLNYLYFLINDIRVVLSIEIKFYFKNISASVCIWFLVTSVFCSHNNRLFLKILSKHRVCLWQNRGDDKWGTRILATIPKKKKNPNKNWTAFSHEIDTHRWWLPVISSYNNGKKMKTLNRSMRNPCVTIRDTPNNGVYHIHLIKLWAFWS